MSSLSVLTCSTVARVGEFFVPLAKELDRQMGDRKDCEHLALIDNCRRSTGEKYNALGRFAHMAYTAAVDDDDWVAPQYVPRLLSACRQGRDAVTIEGEFLVDGVFSSTIRCYPFWIWREMDGWCLRPIMRLCPVRSEISRCYEHPDRWYEEDWPRAKELVESGEIQTVLRVPESLYIYRQRSGNQEHAALQRRADRGRAPRSPLLSILVLSFQRRLDGLAESLARFDAQIGGDDRVELLCLYDNQRRSLGEKWNMLCGFARGKFSTFFGDDDEPAPDYVSSLLAAIEVDPQADAILFDWEHRDPGSWMHGQFRPRVDAAGVVIETDPESGMMSRIPPDLQCIRHEHRASVPYPNRWYGEDWPHEVAMVPLLKRVIRIPRMLYHKNQDPTNDYHLRKQAEQDRGVHV